MKCWGRRPVRRLRHVRRAVAQPGVQIVEVDAQVGGVGGGELDRPTVDANGLFEIFEPPRALVPAAQTGAQVVERTEDRGVASGRKLDRPAIDAEGLFENFEAA